MVVDRGVQNCYSEEFSSRGNPRPFSLLFLTVCAELRRSDLPYSRLAAVKEIAPGESFYNFGSNRCRDELRSFSELYSILRVQLAVTPQTLLPRDSISRSGGARSLSTKWNGCPPRCAAPRRGEGQELLDFKLVRLLPPRIV